MSTDYYLVDPEGKNVLALGSWYGLALLFESTYGTEAVVTEDVLSNAEDTWIAPTRAAYALAWMKERTGGRPVYLRNEQGNCEWEADEDAGFVPLPDWTAETVYRKARRGWTPRPELKP